MKSIRSISFFLLLMLLHYTTTAQKKNFDVVSYISPKGWQQQPFEGGIQLTKTDKATGDYVIALITKATATTAAANENFSIEWDILIKGAVQANDAPAMQDPVQNNGWDIISGTANYTDGEQKGVATLITATGGGQTASVVLMTNTDKYQNEMLAFVNSLSLSANTSANQNSANNSNTKNASINGMWVFYNTESSGISNGIPQLTGGYMRREYVFYQDGTYMFRAKDWLVYVKDILFVYESGTYAINGNQITLTPKKGKGEWWSKVPNNTKAWGKLARASANYKLEKTTYTFDFAQYEGNDEITLLLKTSKPTEREGKDGDKTGVQEFRYKSRDIKKSLIDNPPGFKTK